jgi:branched-subunit amino acid transport protein
MDHLWMVTGMALVTFLIRYSLLALSGRFTLPAGVRNALRYVPPAVLTAIIVPAAVYPDGHHLQLTYANPYLMGAIATAAIGWASKNLLVTIVAGMGSFIVWQWVLL